MEVERYKAALTQLLDSVKVKTPEFMELYQELVAVSATYTKTRATWRSLSRQEKINKSEMRTRQHDLVISSLDVLERYFKSRNWNTTWRNMITTDTQGEGRKMQGDFAAYLTMYEAHQNR